MNSNNIIFYDLETGGANPFTCQPLQLSAVAIDGRRLNVIDGSLFNSYIKPIPDDKCEACKIAPVEDEALEINGITRQQLEAAPDLKVVWKTFVAYTEKYKKGKGIFGLPIRAGYNITRFDNVILDRLMGGHAQFTPCDKEPYKFGPWDDDRREQRLFNPRDCLDMMSCYIWPWTENNSAIRSISMDAVREWLGLEHDRAHNAVADVVVGAHILMRFMKLVRSIAPKVNFDKSLASENENIKKILDVYLGEK